MGQVGSSLGGTGGIKAQVGQVGFKLRWDTKDSSSGGTGRIKAQVGQVL